MNHTKDIQYKIQKYRYKNNISPDKKYENRLAYYLNLRSELMSRIPENSNSIDSLKQNIGSIQIGGAKKKKVEHKEPKEDPNDFEVGTIKKGSNNKDEWIVVSSKNDKRWELYRIVSYGCCTSNAKCCKNEIKYDRATKKRKIELEKLGDVTQSFISKDDLTSKSKKRIYYIHDNGGRPFKVVANKEGIFIYTHKSPLEDRDRDNMKYDILLQKIKNFKGYWSGFDSSYYEMHGNSILIQVTKKSYISIGWKIQKFETSEEIIDYISPVGNSDVLYPVAYSKNFVYFMLENQYVDKKDLLTIPNVANAEDIYGEFYGHIYPLQQKKMKKHKFKKLKLLHDRVY
jgi:hypothetical protein